MIIDVNIIKSAESFLAAMLLVVALTCSMAIFAVLIHSFFAPEGEEKFGKKSFQIPMIILIGLVIIGAITYLVGIDLYFPKIKNQEVITIQPQDNSTVLPNRDSKTK